MAGPGNTIPKPDDQRRRRNAQPDKTVLPAEGYHGPSPDLPSQVDKQRWLTVTRRWWEGWRHAPQAATFGDTDWLFLLETAVLVDRFYRGDATLAGEIRLRVGKLGATPEDRLRLRMTFGQPEVGGQQVERRDELADLRAKLRPAPGG